MDIIFERKNKQDQTKEIARFTVVKFVGDIRCEFSLELPYIYGNNH